MNPQLSGKKIAAIFIGLGLAEVFGFAMMTESANGWMSAAGVLLFLLSYVGFGVFAGWLAGRKGRSVKGSVVLGFFFSVWAVIFVLLLPPKKASEGIAASEAPESPQLPISCSGGSSLSTKPLAPARSAS